MEQFQSGFKLVLHFGISEGTSLQCKARAPMMLSQALSSAQNCGRPQKAADARKLAAQSASPSDGPLNTTGIHWLIQILTADAFGFSSTFFVLVCIAFLWVQGLGKSFLDICRFEALVVAGSLWRLGVGASELWVCSQS